MESICSAEPSRKNFSQLSKRVASGKRALKRKRLEEARLRVHEVARRVESVFAQARQQAANQAPTGVSVVALTRIVADWKAREKFRRAQALMADLWAGRDAFEAEYELLRRGLPDKGEPVPDDQVGSLIRGLEEAERVIDKKAREIALQAGLLIPKDHPAHDVLWHLVQDAWCDVLHHEERWRNLDYSTLLTTAPEPAAPLAAQPARPVASLPLMEVRQKYLIEHPVVKTYQNEHERVFKRFREVIGGDLPIRTITKADVVAFKDLMFRAPRVVPRADRALSWLKRIEKYADKDVPRIDRPTVRKHMSFLNSIFSYAVENGYAEVNPVEGTIPDPPRNKGPRYIPFNADDIALIFGPAFAAKRDENYWLPLLALWTGARPEELCQLHRADLRWEQKIAYLDITEQSEDETAPVKSVKNEPSRRCVPLHPKLLALGFVAYVQNLDRRQTRIFPNLKPDKDGRLNTTFSKRFARYLDQLGITHRRKVLYSFRHLFKALCRQARIQEEVHDAFTGHADGRRRVSRNYGRGYELSFLYDEICRIEVPGFPL